MTSFETSSKQSPWMSVWLRPRDTIDYVLAEQPRRFLWLLAALGAIATLGLQLFANVGQILDWRVWTAIVGLGVVAGIPGFYVVSFIFTGIGRLLGGRASSTDLRAMLAWSGMPGILGLVIAMAIVVLSLSIGGPDSDTPSVIALLPKLTGMLSYLWSVIIFALMFARVQGFGFAKTATAYIFGTIVISLLSWWFIALPIRTLLFQPFNIPARSMMPTLLAGDQIFVSKYAYGYSHYSIPFSPPLFSGRIFGTEPARGDVVVFRLPKDGVTDFVKRIVGLPGDRIQMKDGLLYINDVPVKRERLADFTGDDACGSIGGAGAKRWRETLPNGASFETLDCLDGGFYDNTNLYTVPPGNYFMLGDNRDNSSDSRVLTSIGYIPFENLIGRVGMIYSSTARGSNGEGARIRTERIGQMVH